MLSLVKLEKKHIQNIDTDFVFRKCYRDEICEQSVNGYAAVIKDEPVALGGIHPLWSRVAEGYIIVGKAANEYPIKVAKTTKLLIKKIVKDNNLSRLQASICINDKKALRFVQWLKFTEEGIMRKFGPDGSDYMRYAWVK